jgi:EAL domain-containing protein (putative c-di-GMP-specific phosphodiesterase class I)
LRRFPFDQLKIDRGLVAQLGRDRRDENLVAGAVALGHSLGLEVVGEGVETAAQLEWLRQVGCDLVQGHLLGWPGEAAAIERLAGGDTSS